MILLFIVAVASQLLGPSLQLFLMDASPDAPSLAAALHHSALNIGNSLGAALGAAVLAAGFGLLRSEEHTSELQSRGHLVCRLLLEKKKKHSKLTTRRLQES